MVPSRQGPLAVPRGCGEEQGHVPHQVVPSHPHGLLNWGAVAQGCPCLPNLSPEAGTLGCHP